MEVGSRKTLNGFLSLVTCHSSLVTCHLSLMLNDLRYSLRGFRQKPVFTLTAVLTIALGIGAATAVFSVVDRILFRSLPYPEADRLVSVGIAAPIEPQEFMLGTDYLEWRQQQMPFEKLTVSPIAT